MLNSEVMHQLSPKNEMVIEDSALDKFALQATWKSSYNIVAFASPFIDKNEIRTLQLPLSLYSVKWNTDMHQSVGRKLVNESHLVFVALQKLDQEIKNSAAFNEQLVKYSRNYRSILRSCVLQLRSSFQEDLNIEECEKQMHLYGMMELIWSLCEILFIEKLPDGVVVLQLMEWLKWHFPVADELVQECMRNDDDSSPSNHPKYWDCIFALVLQGQITEARDLLKLHPQYQTQVYDAFSSLDELLRKMPTFQHALGQSVSEFDMKWHFWHDECRKRLMNGDFDTKPQLKTIGNILCGDEETIGELRHLCENWYQMLISYLFYRHPTINAYDMHFHSKACIELCGGFADFGSLDNILLAAFKFDISQVIRECCNHLSSWWLPAHLCDLLNYCQLLPDSTAESNGNLRECLIVEYASSLSQLDFYWLVVADYLAYCGPQSEHYLPLFVQRIPLTSEKKASKVLKLCRDHGFYSEAQSVCRQMCRRALQYNRLGTALSWSIEANDSSCAMYVANKLLEEYSATGHFANIDLIDYLGPSVLLSERLTFLVKYRDFHKLYAQEKFSDAAKLLFNLIVNAKAPLEFRPSLFLDCLPLLERETLFYGTDATTKLLACLNTLDELKNFEDLDNAKRKQGKQIENLRLALTKNLAKAIVS